jgi:hypothetical protein
MRHRLLHFLLLLLEAGNVAASIKRAGKYCFDGCYLTLNYVDFNDTSPALSKKRRTCQSVRHATSLYLCLEVYCEKDGRDEWLRKTNETCSARVPDYMPPWSIIDEYTPEDVARLRRLRAEEGGWDSRNPPLNEVVIPEESFFERAYKTLVG